MSALVLSVEEVEAPVVVGGGLAAVKLDPEHEGFPRADDLRGSLNRDIVHNLHSTWSPGPWINANLVSS